MNFQREQDQRRTDDSSCAPSEIDEADERRAAYAAQFGDREVRRWNDEAVADAERGESEISERQSWSVDGGEACGDQNVTENERRARAPIGSDEARQPNTSQGTGELDGGQNAGLRVGERPAGDEDGQHRTDDGDFHAGQDEPGKKEDEQITVARGGVEGGGLSAHRMPTILQERRAVSNRTFCGIEGENWPELFGMR